MNPHAVLGVSPSASKDEAKAAFRRLAQKYHPDRGGNETKFKEVKAAWEMIERGYQATPSTPKSTNDTPYKSSFTDPTGGTKKPQAASQHKSTAFESKARPQKRARPAPGYEARGPLVLPRTTKVCNNRRYDAEITLEITHKQWFEGCVVPFRHDKDVYHYEVRPGTVATNVIDTFSPDTCLIGRFPTPVKIKITLSIQNKPEKPEEKSKDPPVMDHLVTHEVCALGLFSGGKIETKDARGEGVSLTIQPGFDPKDPIVVEGRGHGKDGQRGRLLVKIVPVFKAPSLFSENERKMLNRVNELAK